MADARLRIQAVRQHVGDVGACHLGTLDLLGEAHQAGGRFIGQASRPDDGPVKSRAPQRRVGVSLGLDVRLPDRLGLRRERLVDADGADAHRSDCRP